MASDKDSNNPFDFLNQFSQLGDLADIKKWLGPDFFKNLPMPQIRSPWFADGHEAQEPHEDPFPRVDLYSHGPQEIVAVFELPGLTTSNDVQVSVTPHSLRVKGQTTARYLLRGETVWRSECHHGPFEREIELPERVLVDQVRALYRNGLLVVYLTRERSHESLNRTVSIDFDGD
jgi:HSP20 family protein